MTTRLFGAALAAGLLAIWTAPPASADIIRTRDGRWLPRGVVVDPGVTSPNGQLMEEHKSKRVDPFAYDSVKLGGVDVPVADVAEVWINDAEASARFQEGIRSASGGDFAEAATAFLEAADELKGVARMYALYQQCTALAAADDADGMVGAIDTLLGEFPKSFYLAELQLRRARVLRSKGQTDGALAALDKIAQAPGMPRSRVHEAELMRIYLTKQFDAGRDPERWAGVEAAYRDRLAQIEKEPSQTDLQSVTLVAVTGVGRSLVFQGKPAEARPLLERVANAAAGTLSNQALAVAYAGLGDAVLAEAREVQAKVVADKSLKPRSAELLDLALRHYLRVALLYNDDADRGDLLHARLHVARVLVSVFNLSEEKDCEAADRALGYYKLSLDMMGGGADRNAVGREAKDLVTRRDKACGKKK